MNIIQTIPPVTVSDRLLALIRKWAELAPSECRIQAEWDGGFSAQIGHRIIHFYREITQSEYDHVFCRLLDAIATDPGLIVASNFNQNTFRVEIRYWTPPTLSKELAASGDLQDGIGDRLTATLSAYTQALEALQNEPN